MKATAINFARLREYIDETNASNSNNDKLAVLEKYKDDDFIRKILHYTYNDLLQFRVTSDNLKKNKDIAAASTAYGSDLFRLLDDLHNSVITGHNAIGYVNTYIHDHRMYADIIYKIIDRNLETRVTASLINRVIPNLIPEFDVALCESYDKLKKKPDFKTETWFQSRKLDGCRALVELNAEGNGVFYSRSGKEFKTLSKVLSELKRLGFKDIVLDGELCIVDEKGQDDFTAIMKEITKKDHTVENPKYKIFDILTREEFYSKTSTSNFSERLKRIESYNLADSKIVELLEQNRIENQEYFDSIRAEAAEKGWEGLIIRKDTTYQGKRSKDVLKVKNFFDAEFVVDDVIIGPMRVIETAEDGTTKEITEDMLSAVMIKHKGFDVKVGSGFSMAQRREFYQDSSKIKGKTITVQYFAESKNENGGLSLRFPTVKAIYEGERTI
jgi:DNA ligase-1